MSTQTTYFLCISDDQSMIRIHDDSAFSLGYSVLYSVNRQNQSITDFSETLSLLCRNQADSIKRYREIVYNQKVTEYRPKRIWIASRDNLDKCPLWHSVQTNEIYQCEETAVPRGIRLKFIDGTLHEYLDDESECVSFCISAGGKLGPSATGNDSATMYNSGTEYRIELSGVSHFQSIWFDVQKNDDPFEMTVELIF